MADENRIAGVASLSANGTQYDLGGTITYSPSLVEREGMAGLSGPTGYKETPRIPYFEVELHTTSGLDFEDLEAFTNGTVQINLANGKTYVLRQAWTVPPFDGNAADGTVTVRFEGLDCRSF